MDDTSKSCWAGVRLLNNVVSPPLLLREKLITISDRTGRRQSDSQDINFLMSYCRHTGRTLDLRGDSSLNVSARRGLGVYKDMGGIVDADVVIEQ